MGTYGHWLLNRYLVHLGTPPQPWILWISSPQLRASRRVGELQRGSSQSSHDSGARARSGEAPSSFCEATSFDNIMEYEWIYMIHFIIIYIYQFIS